METFGAGSKYFHPHLSFHNRPRIVLLLLIFSSSFSFFSSLQIRLPVHIRRWPPLTSALGNFDPRFPIVRFNSRPIYQNEIGAYLLNISRWLSGNQTAET